MIPYFLNKPYSQHLFYYPQNDWEWVICEASVFARVQQWMSVCVCVWERERGRNPQSSEAKLGVFNLSLLT